MALNTAQTHLFVKLNLLTLALAAIIFGLWPRVLLAQDSGAGQQVLQAINAARAENGLASLAENSLLDQAAQNHVDDMLTNYVYGHYGSDGSTVQVRVARTGYSSAPWVSENWVSASDPSGAMRWWMNDYIHRVNILTGNWHEIGIGVGSRGSEMIFVTVFSAGGGSGVNSEVMAAAAPQQEEPPPPSIHIEQVAVPPEGLDYTVEGGDTLLAIGLRYGLPWERIANANGLTERSLLQIGQAVHIPGSGTPAAPKPKVKTEDYTVQPNDTLWTIAAQRDMYWDDVADVNGFDEQTVLQIGQVIQVPVVEKPVEPIPLVNTRNGEGPLSANESADDFNSYTLMQFDPVHQDTNTKTLTASSGVGGPAANGQTVAMAFDPNLGQNSGAAAQVIAQHQAEMEFEESQPSLEKDTAEKDDSIQTTAIASAAVAQASSQETTELYEVEAGDTIISIAAKFNLEWGPLLALNGLTEESVLQLGQVIRLR
jgi:LysM repeat protein